MRFFFAPLVWIVPHVLGSELQGEFQVVEPTALFIGHPSQVVLASSAAVSGEVAMRVAPAGVGCAIGAANSVGNRNSTHLTFPRILVQMVGRYDICLCLEGCSVVGHLTAEASRDCALGPWEPQGPCDRPCGGGAVSWRRQIQQQPTGPGAVCPVASLLLRELPCNPAPCPALEVGAVQATPARPTAGKGLQMVITGSYFEADRDALRLVPEGQPCSIEDAVDITAFCKPWLSNSTYWRCGHPGELVMQSAGKYQMCVCDAKYDGTDVDCSVGSSFRAVPFFLEVVPEPQPSKVGFIAMVAGAAVGAVFACVFCWWCCIRQRKSGNAWGADLERGTTGRLAWAPWTQADPRQNRYRAESPSAAKAGGAQGVDDGCGERFDLGGSTASGCQAGNGDGEPPELDDSDSSTSVPGLVPAGGTDAAPPPPANVPAPPAPPAPPRLPPAPPAPPAPEEEVHYDPTRSAPGSRPPTAPGRRPRSRPGSRPGSGKASGKGSAPGDVAQPRRHGSRRGSATDSGAGVGMLQPPPGRPRRLNSVDVGFSAPEQPEV
mmetsp:Transcript_2366/g.5238  ORF Transcript_2366/g.5238 Transcript_2366/m.5238 type:complete len:547 (-) Transcript_2366:101-1741(-)